VILLNFFENDILCGLVEFGSFVDEGHCICTPSNLLTREEIQTLVKSLAVLPAVKIGHVGNYRWVDVSQ
jgi:hypothetical protein